MSSPTPSEDQAFLRGLLRRPDLDSIRRVLADQADTIANMIAETTHRPSAERIEQCAWHLGGVLRLVRLYRAAYLADVEGRANHAD